MNLQAPGYASGFAPWQQRAYEHACEALDAGRLAHGLLICGPAKLGKRAVAERLAARLLCESRDANGEACGRCRGCRLYSARSQADPVQVRPDGSLAHPWGRPGHPDAMFVGHVVNEKARPPKMRTEIVIEQIREVSEKLALTPQYGGAQVVLIDPAEAINHAACNALLKTLEEPHPGRYLWLIASDPARLPATIRSRCQRLELRMPPRAEALAWLVGAGHEQTQAVEALDAARGHPGLAQDLLRHDGLALRREVERDLSALARDGIAVAETAQRWVADAHAALRLEFAAELALAQAGDGLTDARRTRRLASWFDHANRTRDLLRTTVRADLAVAELLLSWREACAARRA